MIFPLRNAHGAAAVLASLLFSFNTQAQNELWVLNETPPSLGRIDLTSFAYQELLSFEDAGYATDLEIQGDAAVVVLENRVVKVDLMSGQIVADTELLGAQEAALLEDGTVVVTRGGLDEQTAIEPLQLFGVLDGDDLGLEVELLPSEGRRFRAKKSWCRWQSVHRSQQRLGLGRRSRPIGVLGCGRRHLF